MREELQRTPAALVHMGGAIYATACRKSRVLKLTLPSIFLPIITKAEDGDKQSEEHRNVR
jgi:hypothetical protein